MPAFQPKKSSYSKKPGFAPKQKNQTNESESKNQTSHYAYLLERDAEGNIVKDENDRPVKQFVNDMVIFENESEHGTYLKIRVVGPIPEGDIFVMRKRSRN